MKPLWQNTRKIPHSAIVRAPGLLPMLYTLGELEDELRVPVSILRAWMEKGVPYQHDRRGHIWINGQELAEWIQKTKRPKHSRQLGDDEAFCLRCRKAVKLLNPQQRIRGHQILLSSTCPQCGSPINRGGRHGEP